MGVGGFSARFGAHVCDCGHTSIDLPRAFAENRNVTGCDNKPMIGLDVMQEYSFAEVWLAIGGGMTRSITQRKAYINARVDEYIVPPIKDMLVLGKEAPIGCIAMRRALELLVKTPFEHIEIEGDDTISDILVRKPLLRRLPREGLVQHVLAHIKPLMGPEEVLHVELGVTVALDGGAL